MCKDENFGKSSLSKRILWKQGHFKVTSCFTQDFWKTYIYILIIVWEAPNNKTVLNSSSSSCFVLLCIFCRRWWWMVLLLLELSNGMNRNNWSINSAQPRVPRDYQCWPFCTKYRPINLEFSWKLSKFHLPRPHTQIIIFVEFW